ncbi:MAG: hypothetical protein BHV77_01380 [Bacteroides sp. 43_108]|nr:MAG: hypothetical protein BHV77_01380 [Bacteroides sp. 43_108]
MLIRIIALVIRILLTMRIPILLQKQENALVVVKEYLSNTVKLLISAIILEIASDVMEQVVKVLLKMEKLYIVVLRVDIVTVQGIHINKLLFII